MYNKLESKVEGVTWPAIPSPLGATVLSILFQLEETQWRPAETLREQQFRQLSKVLPHAYRTIKFYHDRFDRAGVNPAEVTTLEKLCQIPLLTRTELQKSGLDLLSSNIPKSHGKTFETQTSGATGTPVKVTNTSFVSLFWKAIYLRENLWHGRDLSKTMAAIRYADRKVALPPDGLSAKVWGSPEQGTFKTGPAALLNIRSSIAEQADWLNRLQPEYLASYPTNILLLAKHFMAAGKKLPSLVHIRTVGEILEPHVREACRHAWDVPVVDMYSCQELGVIALQCPDYDHYHVQSESLVVEVVDEQGRPCAPGETGRVVITTLHNFAMPLIRYEVGDYAEVGEACPCGRGLPVLSQVLGRQRNMLHLPNGEKSWPTVGFISTLADDLPIIQAQFVQKSLEQIEVRLVVHRPLNAEEENRIITLIHERFHYPFKLTFTYMQEIPRSKGGKYEDFRSELSS